MRTVSLRVTASLVAVATLVDLSMNEIGPTEGELIASAITGAKSLTTLNLRANSLGPQGGRAIADALQSHPSLSHVNVLGNKLDREAVKRFAEIKAANPTIVTLCGIAQNDRFGKKGAVDLARARLTDVDALLIANELASHVWITDVDLKSNDITGEGAWHIEQAKSDGINLSGLPAAQRPTSPALVPAAVVTPPLAVGNTTSPSTTTEAPTRGEVLSARLAKAGGGNMHHRRNAYICTSHRHCSALSSEVIVSRPGDPSGGAPLHVAVSSCALLTTGAAAG